MSKVKPYNVEDAEKLLTKLPCVYTDEEFEFLLQKALKDSFVSNDEVEKIFEEWDCGESYRPFPYQ